MKIDHAKKVLNAILEGCEDVDVITALIDKAWQVLNAPTKSIPIVPVRENPGPKTLHVNGRTFRSVKKACEFYEMMGQYTAIVKRLREGAFPKDLFPQESEPRRKMLPTDINYNVTTVADKTFNN